MFQIGRCFEKSFTFLFGEHLRKRFCFFNHRHFERVRFHVENPKPVFESENSLFEIADTESLRDGKVVEVSIQFIDRNEVWNFAEMDGKESEIAALIGEQTRTVLLQDNMLLKFLESGSKTWD